MDVVLGPLVRGRLVDGSPEDFAISLLRRLDTALSQTKENNIVASRRQNNFYDARLRHEPYEVGDLVWLNDPTESRRKPAPHWKGPYLVQRRMDRDGEVGVTYQTSSPFGEQPLSRPPTMIDRLLRYSLPVALPLEGLSEPPLPSPPTALQEEAALPGRPAGVSLSDGDVACGRVPL